jgi:hypothetical protein
MSEQRIASLCRELEYLTGLIEVYNASRRFAGHSSKLQARVFDIRRQIEQIEAENQILITNDVSTEAIEEDED